MKLRCRRRESGESGRLKKFKRVEPYETFLNLFTHYAEELLARLFHNQSIFCILHAVQDYQAKSQLQ